MNETLSSEANEIIKILSGLDSSSKAQILREVVQVCLRFTTQEIDELFAHIVSLEYPEYDGKTGPKLQRLQKIRKAFYGKENDEVSMQELAAHFSELDNPSKAASNAIAVFNAYIFKHEIPIRIDGSHGNLGTTYKFMRVLQ